MNLVSVEHARVRYADALVLDDVSLGIDDGDRIGVIGRNGSGKSSLLRVLSGVQPPDEGSVTHARRLTVQYVPQEPALAPDTAALAAVLDADSEPGHIFREHRARPNHADVTALMDAHGLWDLEHVARGMLDRFDIAPDRVVGELSGGQRMRVALARALVHSDVAARTGDTVPLLVLDEPTNHLDVDVIEWLEGRITSQRGAVVLVTHDRYLLDRVVTRIVEVVDGALHTEHGSYADYLANRAERAAQAAAREHRRRQRVRAELEWLQRSPPARTSKSRARIERARQLMDDAPATTDRGVRIDLPARRLGSKVATLHNAGKRYGDRVVLRDVTASLQPGARIGVVGPNGSGKTTLLRLLAGHVPPDGGSVRIGATVHLGWYDQHTVAPPAGQRVIDAVDEVARETCTIDGITLSASGLLERFGFDAGAQRALVSELSGGERRRLELLRVLATAPNLLLLDEPTNDLDLDTLAVLEDFLDGWPGTLVAASHDRFFLDRVCGQLWSIELDGEVREHPGGWSAYRVHDAAQAAAGPGGGRDRSDGVAKRSGGVRPGRLTYNEQRELRTLERDLPALEQRRDALHAELVAAADDHVRAGGLARDLDAVMAEIDRSETRWLELQVRPDATS
ncbi:MAG TPA: ABC-F family ATP-binding cassette domain-containing protein [Euzebyales bacterium]